MASLQKLARRHAKKAALKGAKRAREAAQDAINVAFHWKPKEPPVWRPTNPAIEVGEPNPVVVTYPVGSAHLLKEFQGLSYQEDNVVKNQVMWWTGWKIAGGNPIAIYSYSQETHKWHLFARETDE